MSSVRFPEVTASLRADLVTAGLTPEKILFVGSMGTGTAISGELQTNILNDDAEDDLFGVDSPLALSIRVARRANRRTQIDAIGIENTTGTAATKTITFAGTVTKSGSYSVTVGSARFNTYTLDVVAGDTAAIVGAKLTALVQADTKGLMTAADAAGVVTLTSKTLGTFGNTIGVRVLGNIQGLTAVIADGALGAGDVSLVGVLDVLGEERYQGVVWEFANDTDEVKDFLDQRRDVDNDIRDGRAFVGMTDTLANHLAFLTAENSDALSVNVDRAITRDNHIGSAVLEVPFIKVAAFAAIRALRRTDDSTLGNKVISRSSLDSFGGIHQNSKPYANTPMDDLEVPAVGDTFTDLEVKQLKDAGGWVMSRNRAGNTVITGEVVTTYKTDAAGNPDLTFKYLNYIDTATAYREYMVNNFRARYPQYRATGGALVPKVDMANEESVAAYVAELNAKLGDVAIVITGIGTIDGEPVDYDKLFSDNLSVTLNPKTGQFRISLKAYIVTQFRSAIFDMAISFEV